MVEQLVCARLEKLNEWQDFMEGNVKVSFVGLLMLTVIFL